MGAGFSFGCFLTDRSNRAVIFLTLLLPLILVPFSKVFADDNFDPATTQGWPDTGNLAHQETKQLLDNIQQNAGQWAPGLPSILRDPSGWAQGKIGAVEDALGLGDAVGTAENSSLVSSLMRYSTPAAENGAWFEPDYHHKGFLPIHDALVMGLGARQNLFDDRVRFEMQPYYGQNWLRPEGYVGSEFSVSLARGTAGDTMQNSYGKIAIGFINGDSQVLDSGHGFDMHGELNLLDNLAFHAGVRENEDTASGSYALLRWKLSID
jgi:hypothetical protein